MRQRLLGAVSALALLCAPVAARATDNYTLRDSVGQIQTMAAKADGGGVKYVEHLCVYWVNGSPMPCSADAFGHQFLAPTGAPVSITPTIQTAQYVAGNCIGGFLPVATSSIASVLNTLTLASVSGATTPKQVYVFISNPTASTCTDRGTFNIAAADVSKMEMTFQLTPVAPPGSVVSFATQSTMGLSLAAGGTFYLAIVEVAASETPASTQDMVINIGAF